MQMQQQVIIGTCQFTRLTRGRLSIGTACIGIIPETIQLTMCTQGISIWTLR